ncbi:MAG: hypothetical protein NUV84_03315 [Candidatus Uhrbacteria bacterium]|nr:hypothetical protein [Candidatus Uhrbacteria bacterium]
MMTRRKRLFIFALTLLALLLLLIWLLWVLFSRGEATQEIEEVVQVEVVEEVIPVRPTISEQELQVERETRTTSADVMALSKSFVTRYGSYSNEANFANLEDVLVLASTSFAAELQNMIDTGVTPEEYYGVSTSIVTVRVDKQGETSSQVTVTTQREEAIGSPQNTSVKYQEIILTFVMEDGIWKVDSATWQ